MKTYHVTEKLSVHNELLKKGLIRETDNIDFMGPVFDTETESLFLFKHPDGKWYNRGRETEFKELDEPEIPNNRFLGVNYDLNMAFAQSRPLDGKENDAKYIYFVLADKYGNAYPLDLAATLHHARYVGAKMENCWIQRYDINYKAVSRYNSSVAGPLSSLMDAWKDTADYMWEKEPVNPFRRLLNQAGMTLKEFSDYFGIKYRTVQNWAGNVNSMPEWAQPLFELKLMTDGKI